MTTKLLLWAALAAFSAACDDAEEGNEEVDLGLQDSQAPDGLFPPDGFTVNDATPEDAAVDASVALDANALDAALDGAVEDGSPLDAAVVEPLVVTIALSEQPQANSASLTAAVTRPLEIPTTPGCVSVAVNPAAPVQPVDLFSAGEIAVSGLRGGQLSLLPNEDNAYVPSTSVPSDLFDEGATIRAVGRGGPDVGPFTLEVPAPTSVVVTAPASGALPPSHSVQGALDVRWSAGTAESLLVTVFPINFNGEAQAGAWIFCGGQDSSGALSIPAAQLSGVWNNQPLGQLALVGVTRTRLEETAVGAHRAVISAATSVGVPVLLTR